MRTEIVQYSCFKTAGGDLDCVRANMILKNGPESSCEIEQRVISGLRYVSSDGRKYVLRMPVREDEIIVESNQIRFLTEREDTGRAGWLKYASY